MRKEFDLMPRKRLTQTYARRYWQATTRREKTRIRDEFTRLTGYKFLCLLAEERWDVLGNTQRCNPIAVAGGLVEGAGGAVESVGIRLGPGPLGQGQGGMVGGNT